MEYHVRIYMGEKIQDISLDGRDRLSLGSGAEDDFPVDVKHILPEHFLIYRRNGRWFVKSRDKSLIKEEREIKDGDIFLLDRAEKIAVYIFGKNMDSVQTLDMMGREKTVIGRGAQCDLILQGNNISRQHAWITQEDGAFVLTDNHSLNGVFLNTKKVEQREYLKDGDIIAIGNFNIRFYQGSLTVTNLQEEASPEKQTGYPHWFKCAPRLRRELPRDVIQIQNPPQEVSKPESNWIGSLASPIVMIVVMSVMVGLSVMNPTMLVFTVPMSLVTIFLTISNNVRQKKQYQEKEQVRNAKYGAYLDEMERKIGSLKEQQILAMQNANPSLAECVRILKERDAKLWNRSPLDDDFMDLRVGVGDGGISFEVKGQQNGFTTEEDYLAKRAQKIVEDAQLLRDIPVTCHVGADSLVGIIGERREMLRLVKNMILQAVTHHSYDDLKIVTVFSKQELKEWDWVKWLPHSFDEARKKRFVSSARSSADILLKDLEEVLKQRSMEAGQQAAFSPYCLFVFTEMELASNHSIMKYLLRSEKDLGAGAIFLYDDMGQLPSECRTIIEVKSGEGLLFQKQNMSNKRKFRIDSIGQHTYEQFARAMAPIRLSGSGAESSLPGCVTFLEGYGVRRPQEFQLERMWKSGLTYESMAVPIGVKADGDPFLFDIHEKKYGPHGLVAGMTGSGKSEMVQSWILSMALRFSPQDVSFVLIDFKGTGLLLPFAGLPHLAGTISDLDNKIQRNLVALENELSRRKELLDKYGVNNINNYLKLYHAKKALEPLSYLFIIIDEFAEFKVQFPDFMTVVDRIFAIGRTLGVFAILLTQKPAGVVDDKMNANTRFRWCLKVASSADSKEMIRHPDAVRITTPGRAYVQVGEDEVYELVQSYYSGAPYRPDLEEHSTINQRVAILEESGKRIYYEIEEKKQIFDGEKTEISEVVSYLHSYVESGRAESARQIWLPKLSYHIYLEDIKKEDCQRNEEGRLCAVIGMIDNPAGQSQYPLVFDFTKDGHIAVFGAPGTGKTTLLQTAVMSVILGYSPEDVNVYIMDFGGWSMGVFRNYPHVGGIANDNEEIKLEKLVQLLERKLLERKEAFSRIGVGSLQAYRKATEEKLPNILLVLDNFAPVLQLYPEMDSFFIRLTREGGSYGIYFLVSANNPMALGFKINQNIRMAAALCMSDKSDYQGIVGKTNGMEPENMEGRGLIKGNPPLEFQTALPAFGESESERTGRIRKRADEMNQQFQGKRAAPIPIMPETIAYECPEGENIRIGLSSKFVEPVFLPEMQAHYMPVAGMPGSGKSNMLQLLARQLLEIQKTEIVYLDLKRSADFVSQLYGVRYLWSIEDFDAYIEELVPVLQERKEAHDLDESIQFNRVAVLIDDYKYAYDKMQEQTARRLEAIIRLGAGLGIYLYITEDADTFCRLCGQGEPVCMLMSRENTAILLGGSLTAYPVFSPELSGSEKSQALGKWEGYLLDKGKATRFKGMLKN